MIGDYNVKVGEEKEEKIVGPYGTGHKNKNGELQIEFGKEENVVITNIWFKQRPKNRYT